jgi:folate-binding protein YgfZ
MAHPDSYPEMSIPAEYEKLHLEAGFYLQSEAGYLCIQGPDRFEFIQRQTTNDLHLLKDDIAVSTVLTSPTARIIDVLQTILDQDSLGMTTLPGRAQKTYQFLRSRIFFNDQVSIKDLSRDKTQILVKGAKAAQIIKKIGLPVPEEKNEVMSAEINDNPVKIIAQDGLVDDGFMILTTNLHDNEFLEVLLDNGVPPISEETLKIMRIESGMPGPQGELTEDYTPLETNLDTLISADKGCYTGQEVIARQITYDKVARKMVGLSLENSVLLGSKAYADGRTIGEVTSFTLSPRFGPIALAIVKRPYNEAGSIVSVGDDAIRGVVVHLPFY